MTHAEITAWLARHDPRRIRQAAGMSADTIAAGVGASHRVVIYRWERGKCRPRGVAGARYVRLLMKLAEHQAIWSGTSSSRPEPRPAWDPAAYLKSLMDAPAASGR